MKVIGRRRPIFERYKQVDFVAVRAKGLRHERAVFADGDLSQDFAHEARHFRMGADPLDDDSIARLDIAEVALIKQYVHENVGGVQQLQQFGLASDSSARCDRLPPDDAVDRRPQVIPPIASYALFLELELLTYLSQSCGVLLDVGRGLLLSEDDLVRPLLRIGHVVACASPRPAKLLERTASSS